MVIRKLPRVNLDSMKKNHIRFRCLENIAIYPSMDEASVSRRNLYFNMYGTVPLQNDNRRRIFANAAKRSHKKVLTRFAETLVNKLS